MEALGLGPEHHHNDVRNIVKGVGDGLKDSKVNCHTDTLTKVEHYIL